MFEHLFAMSDAGVQIFVKRDQDATQVRRGARAAAAATWQESRAIQSLARAAQALASRVAT